jgi:selenocysteine-specific elongation factor
LNAQTNVKRTYSGKTSLVKALSTLLSTAALDKNPQSRERGITLDLGFSAFVIDAPDAIKVREDRHQPFGVIALFV